MFGKAILLFYERIVILDLGERSREKEGKSSSGKRPNRFLTISQDCWDWFKRR